MTGYAVVEVLFVFKHFNTMKLTLINNNNTLKCFLQYFIKKGLN